MSISVRLGFVQPAGPLPPLIVLDDVPTVTQVVTGTACFRVHGDSLLWPSFFVECVVSSSYARAAVYELKAVQLVQASGCLSGSSRHKIHAHLSPFGKIIFTEAGKSAWVAVLTLPAATWDALCNE